MTDGTESTESAYYCFDCESRIEGPVCDCDEPRRGDHNGTVRLRLSGDNLVAQPDDMGHYSPHQWIEVDHGEVCAECGARLVERDTDFNPAEVRR
jgi:hypothetical protein